MPVSLLILALLLAVLQVAVYVHGRNVGTASAQEGAWYAVNADVESARGAERSIEVVASATSRQTADRVLQRYLNNPELEVIWVNEPGRVFVARRGRSERTTILEAGELADLVERMLRTSGRCIDISTPFVDANIS